MGENVSIQKISSQIAIREICHSGELQKDAFTYHNYYEIYGGKVTPFLHQSKDNFTLVSLFSNDELAIVRNYKEVSSIEFKFTIPEFAKAFHQTLCEAAKFNKFDYEIIIDAIGNVLDIDKLPKFISKFVK